MNDETIICLVDGNNIRNSFGYENMSALQLTDLLSSWTIHSSSGDDVKPLIICFWDGGTKCTSQKVLSSTSTQQLAVYSGPESNADDIMVQCCAYISSKGSFDDEQCTKNTNVVLFTSDANLANRCQMQLEMGKNRDASNSEKTAYQIYHSIHLCLLLLKGDNNEVRMNTNDQLVPNWDRSERRSSVDELETYLDSIQEKSRVDEEYNNLSYIGSIHEWINNGLNGIQIGRVTKGGSILYEIRK